MITGSYGTMYYVRDMSKAVAHYRERLGLTARYESPEWTEFDVGGHALCLHARGEEPHAEGGILITKVKGLRPLVATLKAKGVAFLADVHEVHPGAFSAEARDADGNVVSFYEDSRG